MNLKKNIKTLQQNNNGVAGIIVAVLLIALIISVVAIIQTVFVPQWMEQKEAEHLQTVFNQFSMLKFSIDTQAIAKNKDISLTTSITLGSKELPILQSSRSYGFLYVTASKTPFRVYNNTGDVYDIESIFGSIIYSSNNAYFLDKTYTYELGALLVSQSDGTVMANKPHFSATYIGEGQNIINLTLNLIDTRGIGEKQSIGGYGTYPIQTTYHSEVQKKYTNVGHFSFPTSNQKAWHDFFSFEFDKAGVPDVAYHLFYNHANQEFTINFDDGYSVRINLRYLRVDVQIAPGWIYT
jgi:hypothetical protein